MKTLIDVLAALSDFVKVASEWAESASKAEVETFTQIYPQKEEAVKKAVEKAITLEALSAHSDATFTKLPSAARTSMRVFIWFHSFSMIASMISTCSSSRQSIMSSSSSILTTSFCRIFPAIYLLEKNVVFEHRIS